MRSEVRRLRFVDVEQVRHQHDGQEWVPHWHEEWSFGAIVEGYCQCCVGGQPLTAYAGDLVAIAPGDVHTGALLGPGYQKGVLVVMFYVPSAWLSMRNVLPPPNSGRIRLPALTEEARQLQSDESAFMWLERAISALAQALTSKEVSHARAKPTGAEQELLRRIQAAVMAGEQSVSGLARRSQVSRERIHRVMTSQLGMTPSDYLRAVRLHRARTLLLDGQPIASVAADCGFADQAHFTRWFRRTFGYTPGDFVAAAFYPTV